MMFFDQESSFFYLSSDEQDSPGEYWLVAPKMKLSPIRRKTEKCSSKPSEYYGVGREECIGVFFCFWLSSRVYTYNELRLEISSRSPKYIFLPHSGWSYYCKLQNVSFEIKDFVETHLCKLRGILRSRVLRVLCDLIKNVINTTLLYYSTNTCTRTRHSTKAPHQVIL